MARSRDWPILRFWKTAKRRNLKKRWTAYLVMYADIVALSAMLVTVGINWSTIRNALPDQWLWFGVTGAFLVVVRAFSMAWFVGTFHSAAHNFGLAGDDLQNEANGGGTSAELGSAEKDADDAARAEARIDSNHGVYDVIVSAGILGYWMMVAVTGGPFVSPIATLGLAGLFLGQIRASSRESLLFLLGSAGVLVLGSLWLSDFVRTDHGMVFSGASYLPAAAVVAVITTWVNDRTFFTRVDSDSAADATPATAETTDVA